MINIGVLVSGRGSNLQAIIDSIENSEIENAQIKIVISDVRDAFALNRAENHSIDSMYIDPNNFLDKLEYEKKLVNILKKYDIELVLLAGYMRILSSYFVNEYKWKILNIHPALLPSFPGLHGQRQALEYGVKVSGATVHFVDEKCDSGPIIIQKCVKVKEDDSEDTLAARILEKEHKIFPTAVDLFVRDKLKIEGRRVQILD